MTHELTTNDSLVNTSHIARIRGVAEGFGLHAVAVRRRRRSDRVFCAERPRDTSADLGQGGCEGSR